LSVRQHLITEVVVARFFSLLGLLVAGTLLGSRPAVSQAAGGGYTMAGPPENVSTGIAPRRFVVRIRVPFGKSRQDVEALLDQVVREQQRALRASALTVFAYRPGDPIDGAYSVGRAVIAPFGDWARAGERGPLQVRIDVESSYFAGDPSQATGTKKRLVSEGALRSVFVSRRFESWGDTDLIARVPLGTPVTILETRTYGPYVTRYRIRVKHRSKVIEGWVHDSDVR
jgi:hypothetical protein